MDNSELFLAAFYRQVKTQLDGNPELVASIRDDIEAERQLSNAAATRKSDRADKRSNRDRTLYNGANKTLLGSASEQINNRLNKTSVSKL